MLRRIAETINPGQDDLLLEIGPGTGALTSALYGSVNSYVAVELDRRVIEELRSAYPDLDLIEGDIVKISLRELSDRFGGQKLKVAGNIPYNITSPIVFKLLEEKDIILQATLMVQLEVAQRIAATPGTRNSGIFGIITQTFCSVTFCFEVSHEAFYPKPDVTSAIIQLTFDGRNSEIEFDFYRRMVKAAFSKRRKQLHNSFKGTEFELSDFSDAPVKMSDRPEQLTIQDYLNLYHYFRVKKQS